MAKNNAQKASTGHIGEEGNVTATAGAVPMQVYVIENGRMYDMPDSMMYQGGNDSLIEIPLYSVLIRHPDGNVLFDSGQNDDPKRQDDVTLQHLSLPDSQKYPLALQRLGLEPADIDYLVLSHLHSDHMGYADLFTNAKVFIAAKEFEGTLKELGAGTAPSAKDIECLLNSNLQWQLVPENVETLEILKGLTLYNFGAGHNHGMIGLLIELPQTGNILLPSDACCYLENLGTPPLLPPKRVFDYGLALATLEKIKGIAKAKNAQVWPAHDPEWFKTITKSTEGFYE